MKKILIVLFVLTILIVPAVSYAQQNQKGVQETSTGTEGSELKGSGQDAAQDPQSQNETAVTRRSRVANAVQEMEGIATRNQGIGDQIRVIAQNQNRIQEEAEDALETAQKRSGFARFFIGPDYAQLKTVEERLKNHSQNLAELKELREQIQVNQDKDLLDEQIQVMEEIKQELQNEVTKDKKGFSLFGWLSRLLTE